MAHELLEHLDGSAGVHVALGVGVPERVGEDPGRVEPHRVPVRATVQMQASVAVEPALEELLAPGPALQLPRPLRRRDGPAAALGPLDGGKQDELAGGRVGEPGSDRGLLLADERGRALVNRQPAADDADLGHVVHGHRVAAVPPAASARSS